MFTTFVLWIRSFLNISKDVVSQLATTGVSGVLRAKLCFTIFRCMVEDRVASDFLLQCDSQSFTAGQVHILTTEPCILLILFYFSFHQIFIFYFWKIAPSYSRFSRFLIVDLGKPKQGFYNLV